MRETVAPVAVKSAIHYPESDGKPVAETETHYDCLENTRFALARRYRTNPQVYVGVNMLLYYKKGNKYASVAPDVFVALGVPKRVRRTDKLWEEGQPPTVIFEFTSESTRKEDEGRKEELGLELHSDGVHLRLFDPLTGEYLRSPQEEAEAREDAEARAQVLAAELERLRTQLLNRKS